MTDKEFATKVINVVAEVTGVAVDDILGSTRRREVVDARVLVSLTLVDGQYWPPEIVAKVLGRDRVSVLHHLRQGRWALDHGDLSQYKRFKQHYELIKQQLQ